MVRWTKNTRKLKKQKWIRFVPLLIHDINRNLTKKEQAEVYNWAIKLSPTIKKEIGEEVV